jgi:hypothetical protein
MTDAQIRAWLDQEDMMVANMIREHGWYIQYVMGDPAERTTSIAHTIGLFGIGGPELVLLGSSPGTASGVLNEVGRRVNAGEVLLPGQLLTFEDWPHRVTVEEVPNPGAIVYGANRHYKRPDHASVPAFQLTYDDLGGRFPWGTTGISIPTGSSRGRAPTRRERVTRRLGGGRAGCAGHGPRHGAQA